MGSQLAVVAPDKVGDQDASLERLRWYRDQMRSLQRLGAQVIVPLQVGSRSLVEVYDAVWKLLHCPFTPGLPANKAALSELDLVALLEQRKPERIHFLGLGPRTRRRHGQRLLEIARTRSPGTRVSMDSALRKALVGRASGLRPLTAAEDQIEDELQAGARSGMEGLDAEGWGLPDYTDHIAFPSEWLSQRQLQAIARELTRKFGDLWRPRRSWRIPPRTDGRETYLSRSLDPARGDAPIADLASTAWGLGVALHRFLQPLGWSGPLSPAIRVLHRADDSPEGRRAVLTAVRFDGGRPESASVFATRFAEQCAREASGFGLLSEWQRRVHRQPLSGSGRARFATGLEGLGRMAGPVSALRGVAELGWGTLTPRREAPWRVYTGTTPPAAPWGAGFTGGLALHVQRIGDTTDLLATASGTFGERDRAPQLMDAILEAIRSA